MVRNFGQPQYVNRAFIPLAIEAGIEVTINSLVELAIDKKELLIKLVEALEPSNPELAEALNLQTLDAILNYLQTSSNIPAIVDASKLPTLTSQIGPVAVSALRDGGVPTQVNVSFTRLPIGAPEYDAYEIYLDGIFQKRGNNGQTAGFINDFISNVPLDGRTHTIRVLYIDTSTESQSLFGQIANFSQ